MPDILLLHSDIGENELIEKLAQEAGFRTKAASSVQVAEQWLKLGHYSVLLMHRHVSLREQQRLADLLWTDSPESLLVLFDLNSKAEFETGEARLLGAEVAIGANALGQLKELLGKLNPHKGKPPANFPILVVEDLDSPRYIISLYIEELGYPIVNGVQSGKKALEELEANPSKYSCVVTDIRMPEMNGRELIEAIRGNSKLSHLPIIVLTAYGTSDILIDCLKSGASGFLVKPPKKMDLMRELARARRIMAQNASPRLASAEEAEAIRNILVSRGF